MKVLHVCYSDSSGGAARAAYRVHQAQRQNGLDSHMLVVEKCRQDPHVHAVSLLRKLRVRFSGFVARKILKLQESSNPVLHSLNIFSSGVLKDIEMFNADVVNLHWIGGEMLSIREVGRISSPIVWTLHDMWAFSGAEHYEDISNAGRYIEGYNSSNRPANTLGVKLDEWVFRKKRKYWKDLAITFVCPSRWMSDCVTQSYLFQGYPIEQIPNCIDHEVYQPLDKSVCSKALGLPRGKTVLLFGAMSATSDPRKGYKLLIDALKQLDSPDEYCLAVFGAIEGNLAKEVGIETKYLGYLQDDISLTVLYNSADIFVAPSLQDNLPNTLVESLACGVQCIAFDIGGMSDLISNTELGLLVSEVGSTSLSEAIVELVNSPREKDWIAKSSEGKYNQGVISNKYASVYQRLLEA